MFFFCLLLCVTNSSNRHRYPFSKAADKAWGRSACSALTTALLFCHCGCSRRYHDSYCCSDHSWCWTNPDRTLMTSIWHHKGSSLRLWQSFSSYDRCYWFWSFRSGTVLSFLDERAELGRRSWRLAVVANCQSKRDANHQFYSKWHHNLLNEQHALLKKTWNYRLSP